MSEAPQAVDAEEQCLGAMLMSRNAAEKVSGLLDADCFYRESNGALFTVMAGMVTDGIPTDIVTVSAACKEAGLDYPKHRLAELVGLTPSTANISHYCKLVKDAWTRRLVLNAILDVQTRIDTMTAQEAVQSLEEASLVIEQKTDDKHDLVIGMDRATTEKLWRLDHPLGVESGIPVPFDFLQPLLPGRLYVLGGYQKDGKTAAALQFVTCAGQEGVKIGFLSLEMGYKDLQDRWLAQLTGISYTGIRTGIISVQQNKRLREQLDEMKNWKVDIIDDESVLPHSIRRYQRAGRYELLVIDHLHRMMWKDRHDLENNIRAITNIAREFEVPVLLLAQLSRAGIDNPYPVPSMRQLRETAMLEAEASAVWFVYRKRDQHHLPTSEASFIVAADRFGPAKTEDLYFDDTTQSFQVRQWEQIVAPQAESLVSLT